MGVLTGSAVMLVASWTYHSDFAFESRRPLATLALTGLPPLGDL